MRVYLAHVIESQNERLPKGCNLIYERKPSSHTLKGDTLPFEICKEDGTIETWGTTIGLGHADFKDEEDYKNRLSEVIEKKLKEQKIREEDE